jgi:predicted nucleic-acid-binding protein
MVTLDTNVVLRILYNDDPAQAALAASAWQKGVDSGGIFLTTTVLVELAWVLRVAAKFSASVGNLGRDAQLLEFSGHIQRLLE